MLQQSIATFNAQLLKQYCNVLAQKDADLKLILDIHGYPPFWTRKPNFESLIHFILEQQVSLASAKAALIKLRAHIGNVTPTKILALTDAELKGCYFSRQKIVYARELAMAVYSKQLILSKLQYLPDEEIRLELKKIKGIGDWTADVFLMMALNRCNLFATGDVALVTSIRYIKNIKTPVTKEIILNIADNWQPYRTIAAYLLWHAYLERRNKKSAPV